MRDTAVPPGDVAAAILDWYDLHARDLPWRVPPALGLRGVRPDPYRVWLSEVMLQQTTVAAVRGYYARFTEWWPDVGALAAARADEVMAAWAGLGYYARARNLHACAKVVADRHGGRFPDTEAGLRTLPGIGPYTAAAIAAIAFGRAAPVVDGNVERVMARLFADETPLPALKEAARAKAADLTPSARPGDYAQAVMDLGATICTPKRPACGICPLMGLCAGRRAGIAGSLPRRPPKVAKPVRNGRVYVGRRADGAWLLERRPAAGLLGGTLGWPGGGWDAAGTLDPPAAADWRPAGVEVRHAFTHFEARLTPYVAHLPAETQPARGTFMAEGAFDPAHLPTLMRKVWAATRDA